MLIEEIVELKTRLGDPRYSEALERQLKTFGAYAVYDMSISMSFARDRYEGAELRNYISELDNTRRIHHNAVITACNAINRMCDRADMPHMCPDGMDDRLKVADFAGRFMNEAYLEGIGKDVKTMDEMVSYLEEHPRAARQLNDMAR